MTFYRPGQKLDMMTKIYRIGMLAGPLGITHAKYRALQMNWWRCLFKIELSCGTKNVKIQRHV